MKCIIIEDELPAQKVLENHISKTNFLSCLGVFDSPVMVQLEILNQCDLVFLDIEMPEISGLDFLKANRIKAKVIITTAYPDYAIDAFEEHVFDYLLKPISYPRFLKGVTRVKEAFEKNSNKNEIFIYTDKTYHRITIEDIDLIEAQIDYIKIYYKGNKYLLQDSLSNWEEAYKSCSLIRVHRSFIINLKKIDKIQNNLIFINEMPIPIGNTYKDYFFNILNLKDK